MKTVLVTGCAGFIGSNLVDRLLASGYRVVGIDNFDSYYSAEQKRQNLKNACKSKDFKLYRLDLLDLAKIQAVFESGRSDYVIHLAARPGVRPSLNDPLLYAENNILGTVNLLSVSAENKIGKFIFGSSSSVYGSKSPIPFDEKEGDSYSLSSPYAASKRSGEFFVESFAKNHKIKTLIFRFFTVYGKRGRPDMAPALFTKAILEGKVVHRFGNGNTMRDYTNVDDIVDAIILGIDSPIDFAIINLGNDSPIKLNDFIKIIEDLASKKAKVDILPHQKADVEVTWANITQANKLLGWSPKIDIKKGLVEYLKWLKERS